MLDVKEIIASIEIEQAVGDYLPPPQRRIVAAAIRLGQMTFALPAPARHHTIMWWLAGADRDGEIDLKARIYPHMRYEDHEQGFIDNRGMFVDRVVGLEIALAANQLIGPSRGALFSEEVW